MEVKFGVKLSGQLGAILTSVAGEVTYEISLM
ncbi:MAG: CU044_2847 family protein [Xenococcaceae cyanobacterium]